jgi:hypothetical protein
VVCGECGATIADKAIICYRCGAPTETPVTRHPEAGRGARRFPVVPAVSLLLASTLAWFSIEADPASIEQYGLGAAAAVSGIAGAWRLLRR